MLYPFEGVKPILKFSRSPYFSCSAWAKTAGKLSGGGTLFTSCKFSSCLSSLLAMTIERSSKLSWLHTEDWELRNIVVGVASWPWRLYNEHTCTTWLHHNGHFSITCLSHYFPKSVCTAIYGVGHSLLQLLYSWNYVEVSVHSWAVCTSLPP